MRDDGDSRHGGHNVSGMVPALIVADGPVKPRVPDHGERQCGQYGRKKTLGGSSGKQHAENRRKAVRRYRKKHETGADQD